MGKQLMPWRLPLFFPLAMLAGLLSNGHVGRSESEEPNGSYEDSVVLLTTSSQGWDAHNPWSKREPQAISSLGAVVSGGRILTTAFAVRGGISIEGRRFGQSQRYELEVVLIDYEINLAILKPKNPEFSRGMRPLALASAIAPGTPVAVVKDRDPFRLTRVQARLNEVSVLRSATSAYAATVYQLETRGQGLGWAEPVMYGGKVAAITTGQDDSGLFAIPSTIIARFLDEASRPDYRGFAALGVAVRALADPNLRQDLGATAIKGGVRVSKVFANSPFLGKLKEDDVLTAVQGHQISDFGDVLWPVWGKVSLQVILNTLPPGQKISLTVARKGQRLMLDGVASRFDSNRFLVPHYRFGTAEPHLIFGGAVFQELSRDYMMIWGKDWLENGPIDFLYTYEYENDPAEKEVERTIILNRVLPDEFNRGYETLDNVIVATVNGQKVKSLDQLRGALAKPVNKNGRKFAVIKFRGGGGEIVFGYEDLEKAHRRIAKNFAIASAESFYPGGLDTKPVGAGK